MRLPQACCSTLQVVQYFNPPERPRVSHPRIVEFVLRLLLQVNHGWLVADTAHKRYGHAVSTEWPEALLHVSLAVPAFVVYCWVGKGTRRSGMGTVPG